MVILDNDTKTTYDKVIKHVSTLMPVYPRYIPKRYKAYVKYCGDEGYAKRGIARGDGPKLVIADTTTIMPDKSLVNGFFWESYDTNAIVLEVTNAALFQKNPVKYEVALQYLLLHEMIHWARYKAGLPEEVKAKKGLRKGEPGDEFEYEAYGHDVSYLWDK